MARKCSLEASSGTTPPYLPCIANLRRDYAGEHRATSAIGVTRDDGGGGLIARGFDAEDAHYFYLSADSQDSRMRRSMVALPGRTPRARRN
jgi:hypothetical protein